MDIAAQLVSEFKLKPSQVTNTLALFDEGATVPFISRYRKERTGCLNEVQVRELLHKYNYYKELDERRATILESIASQGKLTPALQKKIDETISKVELEDLYLPYKPKRVTRGKKAFNAGLEPLAQWLVTCESSDVDVEDEAAKYASDKAASLGFDTTEKIIAGACDILAEQLSDDAAVRKWLRDLAWRKGNIVSTAKKEFTEKKTKFSMYYNYSEPVKSVPSHRVLAMLRGEREEVLRLEIEFPKEPAIACLEKQLIRHKGCAAEELLKKTAEDSLTRLLTPATETEIRKEIRLRAEAEAFKVFGENLRTLLMSPPAGPKTTIGIDPGFRTGCKVVVLDKTGKLLENHTIYPTEPKKDIDGASLALLALAQKHNPELIAIGNGTASRETERFIKDHVLPAIPEEQRPVCLIVNESGASVYSASDVGARELPDQDVTVRGAVSIGRRLQDPLSELVKIEPKSIGVGQYQHDVNQNTLKTSLEEVVESCVNRVGVNLNLASEELLKYVSGLNRKTAHDIVVFRDNKGAFGSRKDLLKVRGLGPKVFEQAAGFLRIPDGSNPLDNSSVHPERYQFVKQMAKTLNTKVDKIIGNTALLGTIDKNQFVSEDIGLPTIEDILAELEKPGRDPREQFTYARFDETINDIADLKTGMKLEGTVTNVTNFGAFVDIGVHQDGLVHISQIADQFVGDPTKVVKVGQIVKVSVLEVDAELKRISLSMRADPTAKPEPKPKQRPSANQKPKHRHKPKPHKPKKPQLSTEEKLKMWMERDSKPRKKKLVTAKPKFSIKQIMSGKK